MDIREYTDNDFQDVRNLMVIVQDAERSVEKTRLVGEQMVDKYLEFLFKENAEKEGKILLAEVDRKVAGFITFRVEELDFELITKPIKCIYISDLAVYPEFRRQGMAQALIKQAEDYARSKDLIYIRLSAMAQNTPALNLYKQIGFREYEVVLVKELDA